MDISELVFEYVTPDDEMLRFETLVWDGGFGRVLGSIFALPPGGCYQAATTARNGPIRAEACEQLWGWLTAPAESQFWVPVGDPATQTFDILIEEEVIQTCAFDEGSCVIPLPD